MFKQSADSKYKLYLNPFGHKVSVSELLTVNVHSNDVTGQDVLDAFGDKYKQDSNNYILIHKGLNWSPELYFSEVFGKELDMINKGTLFIIPKPKKNKKSTSTSSGGQCQCLKSDGKQCLRQAATNKPDKRFCWQHQKCKQHV